MGKKFWEAIKQKQGKNFNEQIIKKKKKKKKVKDKHKFTLYSNFEFS